MSDQIKDGGPAYPAYWYDFQPNTGAQVVREQYPGMSLRDYFVGQCQVSVSDLDITFEQLCIMAGESITKHENNNVFDYLNLVAKAEARLRFHKAEEILAYREYITQCEFQQRKEQQ